MCQNYDGSYLVLKWDEDMFWNKGNKLVWKDVWDDERMENKFLNEIWYNINITLWTFFCQKTFVFNISIKLFLNMLENENRFKLKNSLNFLVKFDFQKLIIKSSISMKCFRHTVDRDGKTIFITVKALARTYLFSPTFFSVLDYFFGLNSPPEPFF